MAKPPAESDRVTEKQLKYDDIGGLRSQKETLQSLTRIPQDKVQKLLAIGESISLEILEPIEVP